MTIAVVIIVNHQQQGMLFHACSVFMDIGLSIFVLVDLNFFCRLEGIHRRI